MKKTAAVLSRGLKVAAETGLVMDERPGGHDVTRVADRLFRRPEDFPSSGINRRGAQAATGILSGLAGQAAAPLLPPGAGAAMRPMADMWTRMGVNDLSAVNTERADRALDALYSVGPASYVHRDNRLRREDIPIAKAIAAKMKTDPSAVHNLRDTRWLALNRAAGRPTKYKYPPSKNVQPLPLSELIRLNYAGSNAPRIPDSLPGLLKQKK